MGEQRTGQSAAESVTAINEKRSKREDPNQRGREREETREGDVGRRGFMAVHSSTYSCLEGILYRAGL